MGRGQSDRSSRCVRSTRLEPGVTWKLQRFPQLVRMGLQAVTRQLGCLDQHCMRHQGLMRAFLDQHARRSARGLCCDAGTTTALHD